MNCLTCHKLYNFYEKSTNCLKCLYFVNYLQTECIDSIPNGYYLFDENLKTIEKCHNLCKTCKKGPITKDNVLYMNCETCLYKKSSSKKYIMGNCPENNEDNDNENKDDKNEDKNDENKNNQNNMENDNSSSNLAIIISIIVIILLAGIISIIIYMKFCKKKSRLRKNNTDYYNIGGKNIPFDDENSFGNEIN